MPARLRSHPTYANVVANPGAGRCGRAQGLPWRAGLAIGLALVVVIAGFGASASAAVTGLEAVIEPSLNDSLADKSVTANCPPGKQLVGTAGRITGGVGEVALNDIIPNAALTSVTVRGLEDDNGTANNWSVEATGICITPPPSLERVLATSPNNSSNKAVTAACPSGKKLVGTGGEISGGGRDVALNDILPGSGLTSVTVQGMEDGDGTAVDWRVRAFAICASPVATLERVVAASANDSLEFKPVTATCSPGKKLLSVGGELSGAGGEVVFDDLNAGSGLQDATVLGFEDEDGTTSNWNVRAFAICAATAERVGPANSPNDSLNKTQTVACPAGNEVTGVGGDITGGVGRVVIDELFPSTTSATVQGLEDEHGYSKNWRLRAYAICATPHPAQHVVSAPSPITSAFKSVTATCPAGERVLGAGGQLNPGGELTLTALAPNPALTSVTATGFEDQTGKDGSWIVTAYAVCAPPPPGLELVSATEGPDSDPVSVTATCPPGKNLVGTGAEITGAFGQALLDDVRPDELLTQVLVTGQEDISGVGDQWSVTAHAICANP